MKPNIIPRVEYGNAICYSGYREGQSPVGNAFPSRQQVLEDLRILSLNWKYLRMYDCSPHVEMVLEIIRTEGLDFRMMLGANLRAEESNPNCPWGAHYDNVRLAENRQDNDAEISHMMELAREYSDEVFAVSIGNEASVDWSDHLVSVERLVAFARQLKVGIRQPVTFCENYVPWAGKLAPLVAELDFLSVHTYPVWEYQSIDNALNYTRDNYFAVASHYPDKPVIITEAGWTTRSNGRGIEPDKVSQELQARYYEELMEWTQRQRILTFVFEAFDEPWKGSDHPDEPEKHWGLFTVNRRPKLVMQDTFSHLTKP